MDTVIHSPPVPFIGQIRDGLNTGSEIIIQGHVPSWFEHQFQINLAFGHQESLFIVDTADLALHFNPRFDDHVIVINSRENGSWGEEKRVTGGGEFGLYREDHHLPLRKGHDFELQIDVGVVDFHIRINGVHYADFPRRMSLSDIRLLHVDGQVELTKIEVINRGHACYTPGPTFAGQEVRW